MQPKNTHSHTLTLVFSHTPVLWIRREVPEAQSIVMMYPLPNHLCIHFICGTILVMMHISPHIPTRSEKKTADVCVRTCPQNVFTHVVHLELLTHLRCASYIPFMQEYLSRW